MRSYSGKLSPNLLFHRGIKNNFIIDPFSAGNFVGHGYIGWQTDRDRIEGYRKGGFLNYYTDGGSKAHVISSGPDGFFENIPEGALNVISGIIQYDPTNGMISRGDIIITYDNWDFSIHYSHKKEESSWGHFNVTPAESKDKQSRITILQGIEDDTGISVKTDSNGDILFSGRTNSHDIATTGVLDSSYNGSYDIYIGKMNNQMGILWLTYFGGSGYDNPLNMAVDKDNNVCVVGNTFSNDFPVMNAANSVYKNGDGFIVKCDPSGNLIWSTYLGGESWNDVCNDVHIDEDGNVYVCGWTSSSNFPVQHLVKGYNQIEYGGGGMDGFLAKYDSDGVLIWSSYLGGKGDDALCGITVDSRGSVYVAGWTNSNDYPTKNSFQRFPGRKGLSNATVSKYSGDGEFLWSIYLSGKGCDESFAIQVDYDDNIVVTGRTASKNFPVKKGAVEKHAGAYDAFVSKLDDQGRLIWSGFLGGIFKDESVSLAISTQNNIYITGNCFYPKSSQFPEKGKFQFEYTTNSQWDIFIAGFTSTGELIDSTYSLSGGLGGESKNISFDNNGNLLVTGITTSEKYSRPRKNVPGTGFFHTREAFILKLSLEDDGGMRAIKK